ncbi:heparinase II/III-like family protein [Yersinia rohdei]|uniref:heparinase II/III domain-containing protein n=1 Tax=Yersinia rohdei TaxID=29485 RepID=UPI00061CCADB|nr:heparinase II/III family protein [Yersinia rohdei]CNE39339.1 heparinase II/III-like family protein [Yersinia rohdei]
MKQFTDKQMAKIRQRVVQQQDSAVQQPGIIAALIAENQVVLDAEILVPATGIATWNHYYYCPDHGVRLEWDRNSPTQHRCPVDSQLLSGEPYDGAWWRALNGLNAKACNQLGLLWQLTGELIYFNKVRDILLSYARYYPDYQVHGGIPYNGPGKANAQTLCEANCLLDFALGYDFIADTLSQEQRDCIAGRLLRTGADFLMQHRTRQLHNHEVKISSAIAVIGLILAEEHYIEFAVNADYGLRYQLEHGLFNEGLWFEGSVHYHFYALQGFWSFEKLAAGSSYSLLTLPYYRDMLSFPLKLLMPDGTFPRINDCTAGQEQLDHAHLYEFAFKTYGNDEYAAALHHIYHQQPRLNLDALLYGVEELPPQKVAIIPTDTLHAPDCGLTIFRQPQSGRALLVKHSPYGGEHDHYDRLNLILFEQNQEILPDLGTTGYGAQLHYGYYKNSASHNTISINQANQPPAIPVIHNWHQSANFSWLDTEVDWAKKAPKLDSHTQVQWDTAAYRDVKFRRRILWLEDTIIDISSIANPHQQQCDWALHIDGMAMESVGESASFSDNGPMQYLHQITARQLNGVTQCGYQTAARPLSLWLAAEGTLFQGLAPANPSVRDISYLILRNRQPETQVTCVFDMNSSNPLSQVRVENNGEILSIELTRQQQVIQVEIPLIRSDLPLFS